MTWVYEGPMASSV
jgi:hypothetical protein